MKKLLALILTLILCLSFVGCGSSSTDVDTITTDAPTGMPQTNIISYETNNWSFENLTDAFGDATGTRFLETMGTCTYYSYSQTTAQVGFGFFQKNSAYLIAVKKYAFGYDGATYRIIFKDLTTSQRAEGTLKYIAGNSTATALASYDCAAWLSSCLTNGHDVMMVIYKAGSNSEYLMTNYTIKAAGYATMNAQW